MAQELRNPSRRVGWVWFERKNFVDPYEVEGRLQVVDLILPTDFGGEYFRAENLGRWNKVEMEDSESSYVPSHKVPAGTVATSVRSEVLAWLIRTGLRSP